MKKTTNSFGKKIAPTSKKITKLFSDLQCFINEKKWQEALNICEQLTQESPKMATSWMLMGHSLLEMGEFAKAEEPLNKAVALESNNPTHTILLAKALRGLNRPDEAENVLKSLLEKQPNSADAWNNLGSLLINRFSYVEAEQCFREALNHDVNSPERAFRLQNLAATLMHQTKNEEAYDYFLQARDINPSDANIESNLGALLLRLGKTQEAEMTLKNGLNHWPTNSGIQSNLANLMTRQGDREQAKQIYEKLIALPQCDVEALTGLAKLYKEEGDKERVTELLEKALQISPNNPKVLFSLATHEMESSNIKKSLMLLTRIPEDIGIPEVKLGLPLLRLCLSLPMNYANNSEMLENYQIFLTKLESLEQAWSDSSLEDKRWLAVGSSQPFVLAYLPFNHRDALARYGTQIANAMEIKFGSELPRRPQRNRLHVGFVSSHLHRHSVWDVITSGWFREIDKSRFELIAYDLGTQKDRTHQQIEALCDKMVSGSNTTEEWITQIREDAPDVLIYPEIGMHCVTTQLAATRLAPVQCVSWGHPSTSGLPTMDYYLSAELLESETAQEHYTEQLVRLPHLGVELQPIDEVERAIEIEGLPESPIRILCPQTIYKMLPTYDHLFVELAQRLGKCQFVFFDHTKFKEGFDLFKNRLIRSFADKGLNALEYCHFIGFLERGRFYGFLRQCTLAFDYPNFSGFTTAMQLFHHGLPMVTLEGEFMRQRLAAGILREIDVTELIATSESELLDKMVYFATHKAARDDVSMRLEQGMHKIYGDKKPIRALENFLLSKFDDKAFTTLAIEEKMSMSQIPTPITFDSLIEPWRFLDPGQNNHLGALNPNYAPRGLIDLLDTPPTLAVDIGCFIGATGAYMKQKWPQCRVVGVEPVAEAAAQARTKVDAVFEGFFEDMPVGEAGVEPGKVDLAVFADVLEHMRHPWGALRHIRDWLSPNGAVLVSLPNIRNLNVLKDLVGNGTFNYKPAGILDITHIRFFTRSDALKMFEQTGYTVEKMGTNLDGSLAGILQQVPKDHKISFDVGSKMRLNDVDYAEAEELCALQFWFLLRVKV